MNGSRMVAWLSLLTMTGCVATSVDSTDEAGEIAAAVAVEDWCEAGPAKTYSPYNPIWRCEVTYDGCAFEDPVVTMTTGVNGVTCDCVCPSLESPGTHARAPEVGTQAAATFNPDFFGD